MPFADGGYIPDFLKIVRQYNASGDEFRIEGICKSACTLFLGIRNVCVRRDAQLMFHAGHDVAENHTGPDTRASQALLSRYNEGLRRYLLEGHHMETDAYHTLEGSVLIDRFGCRECPPIEGGPQPDKQSGALSRDERLALTTVANKLVHRGEFVARTAD